MNLEPFSCVCSATVLIAKRALEVVPDTVGDDAEEMHLAPGPSTLSELGVKILKMEGLCSSVVMTVFNALHWSDTLVSFKALNLSTPLLKQMLQDGLIQDEAGAVYLLRCVLLGLEVMGQHDNNQGLLVSLALHLYEGTKPLFPGIADILLGIPGCTPESLAILDAKLHFQAAVLSEKKKRELFKRVLAPVIGKNIGQLFKAAIEIMNLPPIFRPQKMLVEDNDEPAVDGLPALFAPKEA